jgi:hypothetical protein
MTTDDADALRSEIAQTRTELGETAEALAAKADVKARAADAVSDAKAQAAAAVGQVRAQAATTVDQVVGATRSGVSRVPNPVLIGLAGLAAVGIALLSVARRHR